MFADALRIGNTCIYGLVGRNGAGKTTLLNILSNYDKNYTGVISIDGEKMNKVDYLDMPVAYAMDQPIFFTHDILKNL
ncbi:ATP-binding cassette domain-containing protein [Blautia wexlerae]|uniref:ATP-binding cassette domain-containing protein n=1 Tax=Blautia TaxID=572511 RepID=UPI000E4A7FD4|nr:ATP-binding cassette domain-containing protein [Ruminococcus sp. AF13-37]RGW18265.1 ATP-binding cassette domain-containing protein [Ruminococcus sp. AF13-28]RGY91527.1 ATP-binding cassette domain-containing protein [Ruminococcus sp. AM58-7XD]RHD94786.1 ATP-binding cassette domain-containing protein [Ruminococcus sp. AM30-15AC]RHO84407.1 ATP-binding cassette domain-containing protein [Ruminococcus sp. AF42-9BH]RHP57574.1 ATP-binding cassette domain-containing protein [Ruminococcus sp. AF31-1